MTALNNLEFIAENQKEITYFINEIEKAENYKKAGNIAYTALGHINCMTVFLNCMISAENNDFTAELDDVIEKWRYEVYTAMAHKAIECNEDIEKVIKLLNKRNEFTRN